MGNDDAKRLILARRARFVAAALAGVAIACGGETEDPKTQPSTQPGGDSGTTADAQPQPCLDPVAPDAEPQPCLSPLPPDAGPDADAGPQPCLSPLPPDGGDGG